MIDQPESVNAGATKPEAQQAESAHHSSSSSSPSVPEGITALIAEMRRDVAAFHRQALSPDLSAEEAGLVNAAAAVVKHYADGIEALVSSRPEARQEEHDEGSTRMDTTGSPTDSRTAPTEGR